MIIGGSDAGKTSAAIAIMSAAVAAGKRAGFVDADVGNPSVGPPTCAGLRLVRTRRDLETLDNADGLHFVGGISPERLILQQVVATAALVDRAGLKDARSGPARVSPTHANFIVNDGGASAADIRALIDRCKQEVGDRFDVALREEIVYLGFSGDAARMA